MHTAGSGGRADPEVRVLRLFRRGRKRQQDQGDGTHTVQPG